MKPTPLDRVLRRADDEETALLPPALQRFRLARFLLPPANIPEPERALYPERMTLGVITVVLFGFQCVLLAALGLPVLPAAAGVVGSLGCVALLRDGAQRLALAGGYALVAGFITWMTLRLGPGAGGLLYALPLAMVPYLVHRPEERAWRVFPVGFAFACCAWLAWNPEAGSQLDAATTRGLLVMNAAGTLSAVCTLVAHAAALRERARAPRRGA